MAIITGAIGTIAALFGFSNYLFDFLSFLGIFAPSISAIYIINFFWVRKQNYILNEIKEWESSSLISWGISSVITVFTYLEVFQLTHAYFLDSFLLGGIIYLILKRKEIRNGKH